MHKFGPTKFTKLKSIFRWWLTSTRMIREWAGVDRRDLDLEASGIWFVSVNESEIPGHEVRECVNEWLGVCPRDPVGWSQTGGGPSSITDNPQNYCRRCLLWFTMVSFVFLSWAFGKNLQAYLIMRCDCCDNADGRWCGLPLVT